MRPAFVDAFQTPLRASLRGANRLSIHKHEDRVGVRGGKDAQCDPTAVSDRNVEIDVLNRAVRRDLFAGDRVSVDNNFDWNFTRFADPSPLDVPVWFLIVRPFLQFRVWFLIQARCHSGGDFYGAGLIQFQFAPVFAHDHAVDFEFEQMTLAVANINANRPEGIE